MNYKLLVPEHIPDYLDGFNKRNYEKFFKKYMDTATGFFNELETRSDPTAAAAELVEYLNGTVKGLWKRRQYCDIQFFLMEYTAPGAVKYGSEKSLAFAEALKNAWADKHPDMRFEVADYERFRDNFNTAIFGINMNWGGDKG